MSKRMSRGAAGRAEGLERGRGGWTGSEKLGGVLTRAARSNITADGTILANIAARWKFLPCFRIFPPFLFPPSFFSKEKHPIAAVLPRGGAALKRFTVAGSDAETGTRATPKARVPLNRRSQYLESRLIPIDRSVDRGSRIPACPFLPFVSPRRNRNGDDYSELLGVAIFAPLLSEPLVDLTRRPAS